MKSKILTTLIALTLATAAYANIMCFHETPAGGSWVYTGTIYTNETGGTILTFNNGNVISELHQINQRNQHGPIQGEPANGTFGFDSTVRQPDYDPAMANAQP